MARFKCATTSCTNCHNHRRCPVLDLRLHFLLHNRHCAIHRWRTATQHVYRLAEIQPTSTIQSIRTIRPTDPAKSISTKTATPVPSPVVDRTKATVVGVVDFDTIEVWIDDWEYTLRYIGMDTSETVKPNTPVQWMEPETRAASKALVDGKTVHLEKDVSEMASTVGPVNLSKSYW